tara:strand:+ start:7 stop:702 length:696 start_codon:yes stop_codon:yes gene_type:complete
MPKLKQYSDKSFTVPIEGKVIRFANNPAQRTYIKNRVDRIMGKEPETINWINKFKKNSIFFDVGANIGIYTLYSAVKIGNIVYSFEPHSVNYKNLLDSISLNGLKNCYAFCFAVSNQTALSSIQVKDLYEGVADNIVGVRGDYYHGCVEMSLDFLVKKGILPQPDYIKIDVDGFEDKVVLGALETIQKCKSILVEIDNKHLHLLKEITNQGFKIMSKSKRNNEEYNYIFIK